MSSRSVSRILRKSQLLKQNLVHGRSVAGKRQSSQDAANVDPSQSRPEVGQTESLMDIGTRGIYAEEYDIFRESVRRFFRDEVTPNQTSWEKQGHVDKELWAKMGSAGLLGVNISAESGGVGGDFKSAMVVIEEQCYANGDGSGFGLHSDIVMPYICDYGTPEQIEKFIPAMAAGTNIGAIAMTEPGTGSDLQGVKTHAKKDGDDWILNGSKVFITNGYLANTVIVVAATQLSSERKAHGISLFLVEDTMPGFNKGRILQKMGQKSTDAAELFFEDVRLPSSAILGGPEMQDKGFYHLMSQLPRERLLIATGAQAHAEYMFEITRDYVKKRKAFGKSLSKLQTIQHRLAEMKTEICVSRAFTDKCIQLFHEGRLDSSLASMSKYWASDLCNKVATDCVQLHGGWGYMWEYPIARAFTNVRVYSIFGGSNEIMKELIARDIVK